ncbi:urease subunit beta, partial [Serratia marcescens]
MKKHDKEKHVPPGGYILSESPITFNEDRETVILTVRNTGDRPIQVGSHFHFF